LNSPPKPSSLVILTSPRPGHPRDLRHCLLLITPSHRFSDTPAGGSASPVVCYRPGDRPRLFCQLLVCRRRKGEPKGFPWDQYRDLIIATHRQPGAPVIWCWDTLHIHLAPELAEFAADNKAWLGVFPLPTYAPALNPAQGHLVTAAAGHRQLRRPQPRLPGPHRQTQAQEDPVPAPPDQRLPHQDRPDPRILVII
jgi:hypothetical protein